MHKYMCIDARMHAPVFKPQLGLHALVWGRSGENVLTPHPIPHPMRMPPEIPPVGAAEVSWFLAELLGMWLVAVGQ